MGLNELAAWATIIPVAIAMVAWSSRRLRPIWRRLGRKAQRVSRLRTVNKSQKNSQDLPYQNESGMVFQDGIYRKEPLSNHEDWNKVMRRRLLCPELVVFGQSNERAWTKRVLTSGEPPVLIEVVTLDGNIKRWPAHEVAALDELSSNARILGSYAEYSKLSAGDL